MMYSFLPLAIERRESSLGHLNDAGSMDFEDHPWKIFVPPLEILPVLEC